jgi:glycosyltransferase involved in cell wall biosynthesis
MLLIKLYGVRIAWTAHNLYPHDGGKASRSHRIARRFLVWISSAIFVHGPTPKEIFLAEFPRTRKKVWPIEHGHVSDYYRSDTNPKDARQMLGLREGCFVYLFFGVCKEYKNLELLIEAFKEASDECVLVISGRFQSQVYYEKIRSLAEPFGDRVILRPHWIEDDEFQYHLAACDVVVLPYKEILTSGAVMLALSFGRPVVACRKGALVDIVTPSVGVLFSPDTAEQLAHAMTEARNTAYCHDAILEYARTFDWDRSATITAQVMSSSQ